MLYTFVWTCKKPDLLKKLSKWYWMSRCLIEISWQFVKSGDEKFSNSSLEALRYRNDK